MAWCLLNDILGDVVSLLSLHILKNNSFGDSFIYDSLIITQVTHAVKLQATTLENFSPFLLDKI